MIWGGELGAKRRFWKGHIGQKGHFRKRARAQAPFVVCVCTCLVRPDLCVVHTGCWQTLRISGIVRVMFSHEDRLNSEFLKVCEFVLVSVNAHRSVIVGTFAHSLTCGGTESNWLRYFFNREQICTWSCLKYQAENVEQSFLNFRGVRRTKDTPKASKSTFSQ